MLEGKATLKPGGACGPVFSFIDSKASLFSLVQNHPFVLLPPPQTQSSRQPFAVPQESEGVGGTEACTRPRDFQLNPQGRPPG